jgi:hypothetical protein
MLCAQCEGEATAEDDYLCFRCRWVMEGKGICDVCENTIEPYEEFDAWQKPNRLYPNYKGVCPTCTETILGARNGY